MKGRGLFRIVVGGEFGHVSRVTVTACTGCRRTVVPVHTARGRGTTWKYTTCTEESLPLVLVAVDHTDYEARRSSEAILSILLSLGICNATQQSKERTGGGKKNKRSQASRTDDWDAGGWDDGGNQWLAVLSWRQWSWESPFRGNRVDARWVATPCGCRDKGLKAHATINHCPFWTSGPAAAEGPPQVQVLVQPYTVLVQLVLRTLLRSLTHCLSCQIHPIGTR